MTKRAAPGATIDIPLAHKDALYVRSHYDGISITLHDAPLPNEIAIICATPTAAGPTIASVALAAGEIKGVDGLVALPCLAPRIARRMNVRRNWRGKSAHQVAARTAARSISTASWSTTSSTCIRPIATRSRHRRAV